MDRRILCTLHPSGGPGLVSNREYSGALWVERGTGYLLSTGGRQRDAALWEAARLLLPDVHAAFVSPDRMAGKYHAQHERDRPLGFVSGLPSDRRLHRSDCPAPERRVALCLVCGAMLVDLD